MVYSYLISHILLIVFCIISHYYTSHHHYLQAKSQIHSSVFSQLSAIRSREAWLLAEVDKQCQVKVDTLTRQSDTLQQSLGHLRGLLQVSTSREDSDGSVDSQIVQVLERFVFFIFKLRCHRPDRILPVFVQVVSPPFAWSFFLDICRPVHPPYSSVFSTEFNPEYGNTDLLFWLRKRSSPKCGNAHGHLNIYLR